VLPPEDPKALAQAIQFLQQNPHEADRLGRNGRRVAEERFDRRVVLKQFAEHLEALAKNA
jgi:glycosyltransferase involved in cell wall biosynthesis